MSNSDLITPKYLAKIVTSARKSRGWTQEVLADFTKLNIKTIQRVERAKRSNADTRRALAVGFGFTGEDIDLFNKPLNPALKLILENMKLREENDLVSLEVVGIGRKLRHWAEQKHGAIFDSVGNLPSEVEQLFAEFQDYIRDYMDIYNEISATQKLDMDKDLQIMIDELINRGFSIGVNKDNINLHQLNWNFGCLIIGSINNFPKEILVPKQINIA